MSSLIARPFQVWSGFARVVFDQFSNLTLIEIAADVDVEHSQRLTEPVFKVSLRLRTME